MGAKEGNIFDAHLLMLEDRTLIDEVIRTIHEEKVNAEYAFHTVAERYAATLAAIDDDYLRERAGDMRDVTARVLDNLLGKKDDVNLRNLTEPCILVSHDLTPVDHGATGPEKWCSVSPPTSAARLRTRPSWRGRWAFRPWSA